MGNDVFANGREISCKAADGKSVCAFPDVCFTPPQTPATPPGVPLPYPNTGFAKDATKGSKSVKITNKEVMLKNKSHFKTSTGDEAGCAPKKGFVTSKIKGKIYFNAWSMDVKVEGKNAVRHLDLTTHNHSSFPGNSPTWPYLDSAAFDGTGPCKDVAKKVKKNCLMTEKDEKGEKVYSLVYATKKTDKVKRKESMEAMCSEPKCKDALKCVVSPYSPNNCCPDENGDTPTPHHIVPKSQFKNPGESGAPLKLKSGGSYNASKGPCICVDGNSHSEGKHGEIHSKTNTKTRAAVGVESGKQIPSDKRWSVGDAESTGAEATAEVTGCPKDCIEDQVRKGHKDMGINKSDKIRPTTAGGEESDDDLGT